MTSALRVRMGPRPSAAISASAGVATATGAASGAAGLIRPRPGVASATGAANSAGIGASGFDAGYTYSATYNVPTGAGWTDGSDASANITAFLSGKSGVSTLNHTLINFAAGYTYTIQTAIPLASLSHVTFKGGGTETTYGHTGGAVIHNTRTTFDTTSSIFRSASGAGSPGTDLRFHGLSGLGGSTNYATTSAGDGGENQMGWALYGASDIYISHCMMDRIKGDMIYAAGTTAGRLDNWCQNITLVNSTCSNNGRMGLGIIACNGLYVNTCRWTDICYAILDLEPNRGNEGAADVEISDCLIDGTYYSWDSSFQDGAFVTATASPAPGWNPDAGSFTGSTTCVFSGYIKVLRNTLTAAMNPTNVSGQFCPVFRFQFPNVATKTAILTIEDNTSTQQKRGDICIVGGWTENGHVIRNNTGFKNATGNWYNAVATMGTTTQTGNT